MRNLAHDITFKFCDWCFASKKISKKVNSKNLSWYGNGKKLVVNCKMGKILGFSLIHIRLSDDRCDIYSQFLCWLSLTYFDS